MFVYNSKMNSNPKYISEKQWEHLLSTLSPTKIAALEKTLKTYQNKCQSDEMISNVGNDKENDEFDDLDMTIKSEPVTSTKPFLNSHKTKNRGLTYENGRRNLKSEPVTPEERERRAKRRERNRVAAQKCRERRQQQIDELQQQVEMLRSTEQKLYSTLKELSDEEKELRIKLSNHNCVISESSTGDISFLIQHSFPSNSHQYSQTLCCQPSDIPAVASSYSLCRPRSLPVPCQGFSHSSATTNDIFTSKDESLTPLLSPDSYNILKFQLKAAENTPTTPVRAGTVPKTVENDFKVAFSWSNSIVDQLSMPTLEPVTIGNYLSTPIVDAPFYSTDSYSHNGGNNHHLQSMDWH